ncbi:hypothetical protein SAMN02910369_02072 [Lachnospiraceae bacterium NE2001]|nr:hypothetical protein SAMN02910369_02072 [Lachnospiraceae bacterium NE2001]
MIHIRNIKLNTDYNEKDLREAVESILKTKDIDSIKILKESLDSRHHDKIHYNLAVGVFVGDEEALYKRVNGKGYNKNIMLTKEEFYTFPHILNTDVRDFLSDVPEYRPVIIGSGPAGYNAAIKLARAGFKPIVYERGLPVEERTLSVDTFWEKGNLDKNSNVCFGEGGAGTFSDGKLNTGNKDKSGYFKEVLDTFSHYGADNAITYKAKPHIGTDVLREVLRNMREDIVRLGGEVHFGCKLVDIEPEIDYQKDPDLGGKIFGFETELPLYELTFEKVSYNLDEISDESEMFKIKTHSVIIATGHSARDTLIMLKSKGVAMEPKPFAMGVRVEHKAEMINEAMYGKDYKQRYGDTLPTADYKLVYHTDQDEDKPSRNVFSFCMCPGGYVVNSSSEPDTVVINGMSYSGRSGTNSNSAIVVSINPEDFLFDQDIPDDLDDNKYDDVRPIYDKELRGCLMQMRIERAAYEAGNHFIPLQLYGDFKEGRMSEHLGSIEPAIKGRWNFADLRQVLPHFMVDAILEAMEDFGRKIEGFDGDDVVVTAVESRTSSPVRLLRDRDTMMAEGFPGIVPTGEGAGYAGGITSAAADGIKAAEAISEFLINDLIECYKAYETAKYL